MNEQITTGLSSDARSTQPHDPMEEPFAAPNAPSAQPAAERTRRTKPPRGARRQTGHNAAQGGEQDGQDGAQGDEMTPTHKRRRVNRLGDSGRMPALRLNRYVGRERAEHRPATVYDTAHAPGHLRLTRLLLGLALLAAAWASALLVVQLTLALLMDFPNQPSMTVRFGLSVLSAVGILWLAVVALALIVVGAFSLMLALTRSGW